MSMIMNNAAIYGTEGEGGSEVLHASLALPVCLQKSFVIANIRLKRIKPGFRRQHLTFEPNIFQSNQNHLSIGTAGSNALVLQMIVLPLLYAKPPTRVIREGVTHNSMEPPFDMVILNDLDHKAYIEKHGEDMPEILNWKW